MGQIARGLLAIRKARESFLDGGRPEGVARVIARSWQRSSEFHVRHDRQDVPHFSVDELDDRLPALTAPVLDRLAEELAGTDVGLLLSDPDSRILRRWSAQRRIGRFFDRVQTERGSQLSEEAVGTNGVGSPLALDRPMHVRGPEHVLDMYQGAVCTGAPLHDPISGRTIGAVTLCCALGPQSELLIPLVRSTVADVERHLADRATTRERQLLHAFLATARATERPVVAFLGTTQIATSAARRLLMPADLVLLERLVAEARSAARVPVELSGGHATAICRRAADDARAGWVVELDLHDRVVPGGPAAPARPLPGLVGRSAAWLEVVRFVQRYARCPVPRLVTGEAGSGKSAAAVALCGASSVEVLDAALEAVDGTATWLSRLRGSLSRPNVATVVLHLDALSDPGARGACAILDALPPDLAVVGTSTAGGGLPALLHRFGVATIAVPPLRDRAEDLPDLVLELSRRAGAVLTLSPDALGALRQYAWPGNVRQLESVVRQLVADQVVNPVPRSELPFEIAASPRRSLGALEEMELKAIRSALRSASGNRVKAAAALGISRATLYRRLRAYGPLLEWPMPDRFSPSPATDSAPYPARRSPGRGR